MTPTETKVFEILTRDVDKVVPDQIFLDEIWGGYSGAIPCLRVYICRIRKHHDINRVSRGYQYIRKSK